MNPSVFSPLIRVARQCLVLACCGGALWSTAHAQYDEVQGPGPMVAVPQVTVRQPQVSANERARLLARSSTFAQQQERGGWSAPRAANPRAPQEGRTAPRTTPNKGG